MKILYINSLYAPDIRGGAELSLKLLVEGMQSKGIEVVVLSLSPENGLSSNVVDGVKVYRARLKNSYWPYDKNKPSTLKRLKWHLKDQYNATMRQYVKEVIKKEKPDLVSCHNLAGWSIAVWDEITLHQIPLMQVLHDMYLLCPNSNMYKGDKACETPCLQCSLLRSKHQKKSFQVSSVVGISKSILERFTGQGYFTTSKQYVIHNTRDIPSSGLPRKRNTRNQINIGYLGTLSKIKGIEWLIHSFKNRNYLGTLTIAGKGKEAYETYLKSMVKDPDIHFIGHTKPEDLFAKIDVLVVPSLWEEPLGMVAIEALAHHIPVIANRAGGLKETVRDGFNGLFVDASVPNSLDQALTRLYKDENLYNKLSANARSSVAEILDKERLLNEYEMAIKETLGVNSWDEI
ncbi:glycosyltransferase family 4 protein [Echinicola sp. CAU 1574]|uniref:Glycosyltransferase family 4 protein n=1 Tax=Echinicola arenosa TaxID=2774144 RepID=A0ABR9AQ38_9BACT|nr:glycosyltransferase family 4 protein [Echinicola arenosa]MBD8490040.1 glycosyltransferase family 4 protein [Echinicola arenosa]